MRASEQNIFTLSSATHIIENIQDRHWCSGRMKTHRSLSLHFLNPHHQKNIPPSDSRGREEVGLTVHMPIYTTVSNALVYTFSKTLGQGMKIHLKRTTMSTKIEWDTSNQRNKPVLNGMRLRSKSGRSKWFLVLHVHISLIFSLLAITRVYTGVALIRLRQGRRLFHLYASSWNNSIPSLIFAVTSKTLPPTNTSLTTLNGQVSNHLTCGEKPKHSKETQTVTGRMWKLHAAQHQRSGLNRCCWSCEAASQGVLWSQLKDEAG